MSERKTHIKALVIAETGAGKTYFAGSFPRSYWIITEPSGYDTIEGTEYEKNTVKRVECIPSPLIGLKETFTKIDEAVKEAHQMANDGLVDTLIIDNLTYFSVNRWLYTEKYGKIYSKDGEINKLAMYADLGDYLYEFVYWNITSFPGNAIVTCHEKNEHEQTLQKKLDKSLSKVPDIVGGFRDRAHGLFSLVIFLDKKLKQGKYEYTAQTNKGNGRLAKNRYSLPNIVENISYDSLLKVITKAKQTKGETK